MTNPPSPIHEPDPNDARDEAVGRLINEYFDRRESGEIFTQEEFLTQHSEYAEDLREHLRGLDLIKGIGSSSAADPLENSRTQSVARDRHAAASELEDYHIPDIPGYKIQRPLGRGGMGIVYKAIQQSTGRQVALKVLLEGPFAAPQARKRFEREISLSAQLRHPNIIPIYDSGRADGRMYYAMEYVRGLPLTEFIVRENPSLPRRLQLFVKVGAALRHAHQRGVVHRDLKPSNVLVNADG
ncbi:MAG TPA: serine/threonine-protein kinase, partial [Phycisphaerae bacterium]|nr:serine/threonine-protein kinase [Phycisphaerae bacterium]